MAFSAPLLAVGGPPAGAAAAGRDRRLIQLLGDKDYFVRQKAEQELTKIGFAAVDGLADAADSDDMEIVARSAALLRSIKSNWSRPDDPPVWSRRLPTTNRKTTPAGPAAWNCCLGWPIIRAWRPSAA